jgi:hypothetical protein
MAKKKSSKPKVVSSTFSLSDYHEKSRDLFTSIILVLPLFVIYQLGVLATGGVKNGVDFVTSAFWALAGGDLSIYLGINVGILLGFFAALFVLRNRGTFTPKIWPGVVAESTIYAMLLGSAVIFLMSSLGLDKLLAIGLNTGAKEFGVFDAFILSLGAGIYEETVFRLIGMGGIFLAARKFSDMPSWLAAIIAVVLSSVVFSGIHYIGPMGDPFGLGSFFFRFFAGVILAVIFYLRGFAVAVYTHAIYDIIVMVFGG